ncbi:acyl-CoA dehydrogenase [Alkalilimnicola ehrlichii]|uniref:Acyl-coenzyme A dehydrogenase n=1 Tax=Alkalilimnicola ehrlichii TaxID=351052 RepID=A0A3E0X387_9GAMM|nr:acyl-CoA dehydrogenase [Alkalilimnicola ehrlichii]RFA31003.1 acyl-CoA dehydrogenase [Alkalilimnicola ehrlichii]RFA38955.1 acyl-CoA dehydrogenase [Alkalilimnicola ehrlichii]
MGYSLLIALLALYAVLLYRGIGLLGFTLATAAALGLAAGFGWLGTVGIVVAALIFFPLAVVLNATRLRQTLLTAPVLRAFRKVLPTMSSTEREALEAGDTWWEAELFQGKPDWRKLQQFDYTRLTDEEKRFLNEETETLCGMIDEWEVHFEQKDLPAAVWDYIRNRGFFGMLISKQHGGLGFSALAQSYIVAKIATRSPTAAVTVMVPNSLGPGELIEHYGTKEQQAYWLPRLAEGKEIPCFGLTGPEVGSDASSIPDTGIVCRRQVDGKEVLGISLRFNKRYITLAPVATVIGLAFRLQDPEGLLGDTAKADYGITCALVPRDTPGLEIGRRHYPAGAFMNGPLRGEDVFIPLENIIGGPKMAGSGWRMLVECLSAGRGISLPALAAATGMGMYAATGAYAAIRRQFNLPIGKFEGVQEAMGRIGGLAYSLEACRVLTASAVDRCAPSVVTAIIKYHATEMMRRVLIDAMDIHAGRGIIMGPRNYLGIPWQQLPVAITVEGANIMTRSLIVFGQGAIRCHPYVYKEMEAARANDLAEFDRLLWSHIGYSINRGIRAFGLAISGSRLAHTPSNSPLAPYYRHVERFSAALAFCADVAMGVLGGELKRRESTSARLGDVLSQLYIATAVLKFYEENGQGSHDHLTHARWALDHALAEAGEALAAFCRNFPRPAIGSLLRLTVLPLGQRFRRPRDTQNAEIAQQMMQINDFSRRVRAEGLVYLGGSEDATGRLEQAFDSLQAIQDDYERFLKAVSRGEVGGADIEQQLADAQAKSLLNAQQAAAIKAYDALRYDAILTDDFDPEYLRDPLSYKQKRQTDGEKTTQQRETAIS